MPSPQQTRESLLASLPTPSLRKTPLCNRKLLTRAHFLPGQILNAPLHAPNVDTKIRNPFVTTTVIGPVFSKRRYLIVLWKYFDRVVCVPLYTKMQPHRMWEYVGVTETADRAWECGSTAEGGRVLFIKDVGSAWAKQLRRSYCDLAFPVAVDVKEDITHTCGFLDVESTVALLGMFRGLEGVALEESLGVEDLRGVLGVEGLRGLGIGKRERLSSMETVEDVDAGDSPALEAKVRRRGKKGSGEKIEEERKSEFERRKIEKAARKKERRKVKKSAKKEISRKEKSGSGMGKGSKESRMESTGSPKKSGVTKRRIVPARRAKAKVDYDEVTE